MKKTHLIAIAVLLLIGGGIWYGLRIKTQNALRAELRLQCLTIAERAERLARTENGWDRNEISQALGVWIAKAEAAGLPEVAEVNALRRVVATGAEAEVIRGRVLALSR